jgi:hypothetical protein
VEPEDFLQMDRFPWLMWSSRLVPESKNQGIPVVALRASCDTNLRN